MRPAGSTVSEAVTINRCYHNALNVEAKSTRRFRFGCLAGLAQPTEGRGITFREPQEACFRKH